MADPDKPDGDALLSAKNALALIVGLTVALMIWSIILMIRAPADPLAIPADAGADAAPPPSK